MPNKVADDKTQSGTLAPSITSLVRKVFGYFVVLIPLCLTIPATISWDGVLYVASGASLFTEDFPSWYLLMKEPGVAVLIWLSLLISNSLLYFIVFQIFLLSCSAAILELILTRNLQIRLAISRGLVLLGAILVRGYTSSILQQMLFLFFFTLFNFVIFNKKITSSKKRLFIVFGLIGFFSASVSIALPLILCLAWLLSGLISKHKLRTVVENLASMILGVAIFAIPWFSYTSTVDLSKQVYPSCRNSFCISGFKPEASPLEKFEQRVASMPALLYLGRENYFGQNPETFVAQTALAYGNPVSPTDGSCIRLQEHEPQMYGFVKEKLDSICPSRAIVRVQNLLSHLLTPLYPLFGYSFLFILFTGIFLRKPEFLKFCIVIVSVLIAYGYQGAGISRYNPLLAFYGPVFVFLTLKTIRNGLPKSLKS